MRKNQSLICCVLMAVGLFSSCRDEEAMTDTFTVRNSGNDTIVAVLHFNYPDTLAIIPDTQMPSRNSVVIYPDKSGELREATRMQDWKNYLSGNYGQITIFPMSSYREAGYDVKELYRYPSSGRFAFTANLIENNLGSVFYFPVYQQPSIEDWAVSWKRWLALAGLFGDMPKWPYDEPFYTP